MNRLGRNIVSVYEAEISFFTQLNVQGFRLLSWHQKLKYLWNIGKLTCSFCEGIMRGQLGKKNYLDCHVHVLKYSWSGCFSVPFSERLRLMMDVFTVPLFFILDFIAFVLSQSILSPTARRSEYNLYIGMQSVLAKWIQLKLSSV